MYKRRISSEARVGQIGIGGSNPIRIQSMGTVDTNNTEGCVAQAKRIIDAGGELVRFTTQGTREAENMKNISARLKADGYDTPLVADVHFTAHTADVAALYCEKVRINPGNYVDAARQFKHLDYTDEEYAAELRRIEERLLPFLQICREHGTALRIGVNHGSLSDRIMSRYGDSPEGIVESCMEFLRICEKHRFMDVVVSIKASNTVVMVQSVRLLVQAMEREGMDFPLHLGVTEAGEGEDGRVKSAVGIGALLTEGIGDTIRVSLSEAPENEIPVARRLVDLVDECARLRHQAEAAIADDTVTLRLTADSLEDLQLKASMAVGALFIDRKASRLRIECPGFEAYMEALADSILQAARVKFVKTEYISLKFVKTEYISCPGCGRTLYALQDTIARIKAAVTQREQSDHPFVDRNGQRVFLKIGIMGCIVNGPGEMADADYGYVGAARGKISLYKGKECVEKNIPEAEAVERLMAFIEEDLRQ